MRIVQRAALIAAFTVTIAGQTAPVVIVAHRGLSRGFPDRTTNGRGRITSMSLAEVKALDAGNYVDRRFSGADWTFKDRELVRRVHRLGKPVWVTAGTMPRERLRELIQMRVEGILTDEPDVLASLR